MGVYTDYFQKSKVFMYPLLGLKKGLSHVPKQTYIAWEDVYSVDDRMFLCLYHTKMNDVFKVFVKQNLLTNKYFLKQIELDKARHLFVFDFNKIKFDYDNFIAGKYSRFTVDGKINILDFFGYDDKVSEYIHSFLSPEESHDEYAKFLGVDPEDIANVHEICTPPDLDKETMIDNNYIISQLLKDSFISLKK
tara:strand:+ start:25 stop:600 length:576 start_codon:yes stop_codon:yes gene_type:complete